MYTLLVIVQFMLFGILLILLYDLKNKHLPYNLNIIYI